MNVINSNVSAIEATSTLSVNNKKNPEPTNEVALKRQINDQVTISPEAKLLDLTPKGLGEPRQGNTRQGAANEIYAYQKTLSGSYNLASKEEMESSASTIHNAYKLAHDQTPTYGENGSRIASIQQSEASLKAFTISSKIQAENFDRVMSSSENLTTEIDEFKEKISDKIPNSENAFTLKFIDGKVSVVGIGGKLSDAQLDAIEDALMGEEGKGVMRAIDSLHNSYEKLASDQMAILEHSFAKDKLPENINMAELMEGFDYGHMSKTNLPHAHQYFQKMLNG